MSKKNYYETMKLWVKQAKLASKYMNSALNAYKLFLVLSSTAEPNEPLNIWTQHLMPYNLFLVL